MSKLNSDLNEKFLKRHSFHHKQEELTALSKIKCDSLDQLIDETIPPTIRLKKPLSLASPISEEKFIKDFHALISHNKIYKNFIGQGYYGTNTPSVIKRNILENPGWYTAYTPYQAEIAQGRLEALVNYQTMISELTGMELANASLLDEGSAAAEAMNMLYAARKKDKKNAKIFIVDHEVFVQTKNVVKTRAKHLGIELVFTDVLNHDISSPNIFGMLLQYPNRQGEIIDYTKLSETAKDNNVAIAVAADLLSLTLLTPPGEWGADVVVGSSQRFGVPLGFGGPHAAFFATSEKYKRQIPGRIIGLSKDAQGNKAYRMALQTREQHIKRDKATSNICTAQVLLAVMSSMYAVYHGATGLKNIAQKVHALASYLNDILLQLGVKQSNTSFFDTLHIELTKEELDKVRLVAEAEQVNFFFTETGIQLSIDESHTVEDIEFLASLFKESLGKDPSIYVSKDISNDANIPSQLQRKTAYLQHEVFNTYHTEHEFLRYVKRLENKDLSLVHGMIPLGSCTMKLNATSEMIPLSWVKVANIHPMTSDNQTIGYRQMITELEEMLSTITGFSKVSFQPNSGAQGEYAGLLAIKSYLNNKGEGHRNIAIIPTSAHGTNPASAVLAGMKVVLVNCDENGNVDLQDLYLKAEQHKEHLAALMVTYPSTHGVFEEDIMDICATIHKYGGQVYMDGANLNAQVGLTNPAIIGADVCHLNLHKTFCIPHGGGGPGMGPIAVAEHLGDHLPHHSFTELVKGDTVSSAPFGSASILSISYAYIKMMGSEGLTNATKLAILNANYIKDVLKDHFDILYAGKNGRCGHEFILDCRTFKTVGIEVEDISKRLMDYGFHAPTVSFPVPGTLMIEPTESESLSELNRFCDAMISVRNEVKEIEQGIYSTENNVLKNAPHTAELVTADEWGLPYSRQKAAYPSPHSVGNKYWPTVRRIDGAYGDRNLFCSCVPTEAYEKREEAVTA